MSAIQNPKDTRKDARKWDPYFKKSNVKKLKNLLADALRKGLTEVTIPNRDKEGTIVSSRTLTVFELEQLIDSKKQEKILKHNLDSSNPKDFIPWYYDEELQLSLMYKDQDNIKYVDEAVLNTKNYKRELTFTTNPQLKGFSIFTYTHFAIDKNREPRELDYQIKFQQYPSNNVFVNASGEIDVFTYNISYLLIGERKHNASNNSNINSFVPFVTNYSVNNGTITYNSSFDTYKNSFASPIEEVNNMTGYNADSKLLSYISSARNGQIMQLALLENKLENAEMWGFRTRNGVYNDLYFIPKYSSNYNASSSNKEIPTAYSQIGLYFDGDIHTTTRVLIDPYISGNDWYKFKKGETYPNDYKETAKQYKEILKHKDLLQGGVNITTHPIVCDIYRESIPQDVTSNEIEYAYLSNIININLNDLQGCLRYAYTIDGSAWQDFDFSKNKYSYTYVFDKKEQVINLPIYNVSYVLSKTINNETNETIEIISSNNKNSPNITLKSKTIFDAEKYSLHTTSSLKDPITNNIIEGSELDIDLKILSRSNPTLGISNVKLTANTDVTQNKLTAGLSFTYDSNTIINNVCYLSNTYMFNNIPPDLWSYNSVNLTGCTFTYSYKYSNSGIVSQIPTTQYGSTFTYTYDAANLVNIPINVKYSYDVSVDKVQITQPVIDIISEPNISVTYIGNKSLVCVNSDDFVIWGANIKPFNTFEDTTYLLRNTYVLCDSTDSEHRTLNLKYQHLSNHGNKGIKNIQITTYNDNVGTRSDNNTSTTYEYNRLGIKSKWEYDYNIYNSHNGDNTLIYEYTDLKLVALENTNVKLNYNTVCEIIQKMIPNVVFETLYNHFNVSSINEGFCETSDELPYPFVPDASSPETVQGLYLFKPVFDDSPGIKLDTISDLILVDDNTYPLHSEYYIFEMNHEYYLYCIFNSAINNEQVLPPFIYHLNAFELTSSLPKKDFEYHRNYKTFIKRPINVKTSYSLYGFGKDIFNNLSCTQDYQVSTFHNLLTKFDVTYENTTYCHVNCNYEFDENNKLVTFAPTIENENYTYISKYNGTFNLTNINDYVVITNQVDTDAIKINSNGDYYIDMNYCISCGTCEGVCPNSAISSDTDGYYISDACDKCGNCIVECPKSKHEQVTYLKFDYDKVITTAQKIKGCELTAYLTTQFIDQDNHYSSFTFKYDKSNIKGVLIGAENIDDMIPSLISYYPCEEEPNFSVYPYVEDNNGRIIN